MTLVGYKHREETKEKIRQKALGRKMSEYQKNEIRDRKRSAFNPFYLQRRYKTKTKECSCNSTIVEWKQLAYFRASSKWKVRCSNWNGRRTNSSWLVRKQC